MEGKSFRWPRILGLVALLDLFLGRNTLAQTGPELLLEPWPQGQRMQAHGQATFPMGSSTEHTDDFDLATYDLSGRVRLYPQHRADPRFGWNYTQVHASGDPAVPSDLVDTSVGFGVGVLDYHGWLGGVTFGLGYAGTNMFNDGNAWYGKGDFVIGRDLDKTSAIGFVLDYDGNRTFMPDVPIPGVVYTKDVDDKLSLAVGFPYSSVEYRPTTKLTLKGELYVPDLFSARINYQIVRVLGVFAQAVSREEAFHSNALIHSDDRILYSNRTVEAGLTWEPRAWIRLTVAGGYMFGQQFGAGFDDRHLMRIATPRDEPYVRAGLEVNW